MQLFTPQNTVIAIDPGESTTGIAEYDADQKRFVNLKTVKFFEALDYINEKAQNAEKEDGKIQGIRLVIENPYLNKPVFEMKEEKEAFKKAITDHTIKEEDRLELHHKTLRIFARRAQNVGMNKQLARFIIEYARRNGFEVIEVRPSSTKLSGEDFKKFINYSGTTNQHSRDAAMLLTQVNF